MIYELFFLTLLLLDTDVRDIFVHINSSEKEGTVLFGLFKQQERKSGTRSIIFKCTQPRGKYKQDYIYVYIGSINEYISKQCIFKCKKVLKMSKCGVFSAICVHHVLSWEILACDCQTDKKLK